MSFLDDNPTFIMAEDARAIAHDQAVYSFEGENNLGLIPERSEVDEERLEAWSAGFNAGWEAGRVRGWLEEAEDLPS